MKKTNGAKFKAFYNDPALWANGAFHDGEEILVNGKEFDADDMEKIQDSDEVTLLSGVFYPTENYEDPKDFVKVFNNWEKQQNEEILVVVIPKNQIEAFKSQLKKLKGRIKA